MLKADLHVKVVVKKLRQEMSIADYQRSFSLVNHFKDVISEMATKLIVKLNVFVELFVLRQSSADDIGVIGVFMAFVRGIIFIVFTVLVRHLSVRKLTKAKLWVSSRLGRGFSCDS